MPIILPKVIATRQTTTHPQKAAASRETTTHPQKTISKVTALKSSLKVNTGPADVVKSAKTPKKVKK